MPASAESSPPTVAEERPLAERLVLYLNGATWSGDAAVALQAVMEAALTDGTPLLLVLKLRHDRDFSLHLRPERAVRAPKTRKVPCGHACGSTSGASTHIREVSGTTSDI